LTYRKARVTSIW